MDKKRQLYVNGKLEDVSEEVYRAYRREEWREAQRGVPLEKVPQRGWHSLPQGLQDLFALSCRRRVDGRNVVVGFVCDRGRLAR